MEGFGQGMLPVLLRSLISSVTLYMENGVESGDFYILHIQVSADLIRV